MFDHVSTLSLILSVSNCRELFPADKLSIAICSEGANCWSKLSETEMCAPTSDRRADLWPCWQQVYERLRTKCESLSRLWSTRCGSMIKGQFIMFNRSTEHYTSCFLLSLPSPPSLLSLCTVTQIIKTAMTQTSDLKAARAQTVCDTQTFMSLLEAVTTMSSE